MDAIAGMDEEAFRARRRSGEWNGAEVLAHVLAVETLLAERAENALTREGYVATRATEEELDEQARRMAQRMPVPQILHGLLAQRRDTLRLLGGLSPSDLSRTFQHPRLGEHNVAGIFEHLAEHDREHGEQIAALRREPAPRQTTVGGDLE